MKNKLRFMVLTIIVVLCMTAFTVPAFAGGGDYTDTQTEDSRNEDAADNTQTVTVNVAENDDGSRTVTIGNQSWTLADEPEKIGRVVNVSSYLHLRTGPSTDYSIIGHLLNGTEVEVVGETNGWYEVIVPEKRGYVCGKYLEVLAAETNSTDDMDGLLKILLQYYAAEGTASPPLTPDGNLTLVDDIGSVRGVGKQFITVESKAGNTFYLIIDRDDDGNENVHFLNQVDEADLMALTEDGDAIVPTCICTDKCEVGSINSNCPVCRTNMTECGGKEKVTDKDKEPDPGDEPSEDKPEKSSGGSGLIVVLLLLLLGGGGAFYWFKLRKPKTNTRGSDDLDDYDYGEDDDEDAEYEFEDEDEGDAEAASDIYDEKE